MRAEEEQPEVKSVCRVQSVEGSPSQACICHVTTRQRHIEMAFIPDSLSDFPVSEEPCDPASRGVSFQSLCTRQRGRDGKRRRDGALATQEPHPGLSGEKGTHLGMFWFSSLLGALGKCHRQNYPFM